MCLAGIWESFAANLGLVEVVFELAAQPDMEAVYAAELVGIKGVATLGDWGKAT